MVGGDSGRVPNTEKRTEIPRVPRGGGGKGYIEVSISNEMIGAFSCVAERTDEYTTRPGNVGKRAVK